MKFSRRTLLAVVAATLLAGCAGPKVDVYRDEAPVLDLRNTSTDKSTRMACFRTVPARS